MAKAVKKATKKVGVGNWQISIRSLLIAGSVALNIAFIVVLVTIATSSVLDGYFMKTGMQRYCSTVNDDQFSKSSDQVKAMREYVCDRQDAHEYFKDGYYKYLDAKAIPKPE